jgi:hypothetical protein
MAPSQEQNGAETDFMDPRPLGGSNTPHEHPHSVKSMDSRPLLSAGQSVPKENEEADGGEEQDANAKPNKKRLVTKKEVPLSALPVHDEVDASPEELFTRHHVQLNLNKIHRHVHHHKIEGPLEHVKKKAGEIIGAARAAVHLPSTSNNEDEERSQINVHNPKLNTNSEPMHKVAEGRNNRVVDTNNSSRKFGMSPASAAAIENGRSSAGDSSGVASKEDASKTEDEDFPETLQDAIQDGALVSHKEKKKEDEKVMKQLEGGDLNEPEPFGVTISARSKL